MANSANKFDLRNMEVTPGMAKNVEETSMLDATAKECYATGENETKEFSTKSPSPGELGATGKH